MKIRMSSVLFTLAAFFFLGIAFTSVEPVKAANSYLPHWEHIPDGEPRLFEDPDNPGKYRVYIYGSHDTRKNAYCGYDLVTWSAPVENLNDWRYDGVIFESIVNGEADVLFAPDVVETKDANGKKTYYLYPNSQGTGRGGMVAKSDSPKGPFTVCNWKEGSTTEAESVVGYDPAVFVDTDGRVYGYWGFESSNMAELDPSTMCTLKEGCSVLTEKDTGIDGKNGDNFRFFEASSLRKVKDKYVFVYSRNTKNGEFGMGSTNSTLAYAYGDTPLGPWTYGGTLIDARARETDKDGKAIGVSQAGNTHGSILEVNGQWYVFYHRCIDNSQFSRQSMVEAIDVKVTDDGKVEIKEAEVTSQGFEINGLNPYKKQSAGCSCFLTGGAQIKAHYDKSNPGSNVSNIKNGSIVGFKYLNFDARKGTREKNMIAVEFLPRGIDFSVDIMLDRPWESSGGKKIGTIKVSADDDQGGVVKTADIPTLGEIQGKHALFFVFNSSSGGSICHLKAFQFGESTVTDADEGQDYVEPTAAPAATPTAAPSQAPAPASAVPSPTPVAPAIQAGDSAAVGSFVYKITNPDVSGKGTVTLTGTKKKDTKSIQVPDTITVNGVKFCVTAIDKAAFKGCKKATKAVIGKNVTQIGNQAFQSCAKLKTIKIKANGLKKVGKNAFKGIHSKAKFTVPKKKLAKYKKLLKSAQGIKKTMKIKS